MTQPRPTTPTTWYLLPHTLDAPPIAVVVSAGVLRAWLADIARMTRMTEREVCVAELLPVDDTEPLPGGEAVDPLNSSLHGEDELQLSRERPAERPYDHVDGGVFSPEVVLSLEGAAFRAHQFSDGPGTIQTLEVSVATLRALLRDLEAADGADDEEQTTVPVRYEFYVGTAWSSGDTGQWTLHPLDLDCPRALLEELGSPDSVAEARAALDRQLADAGIEAVFIHPAGHHLLNQDD